MSVSLAWDAKQAGELLEMVRADVVIADLDVPGNAWTVLAQLAARSPVPAIVLIEGATDPAAGFAGALAIPSLASSMIARGALLGAVPKRGRGPAARSR